MPKMYHVTSGHYSAVPVEVMRTNCKALQNMCSAISQWNYFPNGVLKACTVF